MTQHIPEWLRHAVCYQIYPQSFNDTNGDGIGDLPGVIAKLDYLQWLGVTAIWLNPCFVSPFNDAGYDVSDYCRVAPRYGTNADLERLFAAARQRGIRVLLDLVAGHTAIDHPWFQASCQSAPNAYSNWYIWTKGWTQPMDKYRCINGYAERDGNFMINFFWCQPALNYGFAEPDPQKEWQLPVDHPDVVALRTEMERVMRFWLDKGAAGFRVDMASSLVKNDPDHAATQDYWQGVRAMFDAEYPDAALVAEWSNPAEAIPAGFHVDFMVHFGDPGYTSLLRAGKDRVANCPYPVQQSFFDRDGQGDIRTFVEHFERQYGSTRETGYISLPSGNHDIGRIRTGRDVDDLKVIFAFVLTMPGVPFIYYGDEIGMRYVDGLVSKEGGYNRTGARTPMQWDDTVNAGFSTAPAAALYLPQDDRPDRPTVAAQQAADDSLLAHVRELIALRRAHPALEADGDYRTVYAEAGSYPYVYLRQAGDEAVLVALNPADRPVAAALPADLGTPGRVLSGRGTTFGGGELVMGPVSWAIVELE